ncbi:MAG: hypothetical protein B6U89_07075, partial [Desulfurococcales archaeon ex4484_58]
SGYTSIDGKITFTYTPDKAGELTIQAIYNGEPNKYLGSSKTFNINVISGLSTKIVIIGPTTTYVGIEETYRIELRFANDSLARINTGIEVYLNGTREVVVISNGVLELTITPENTGTYNLTIIFGGGTFDGLKLLPSKNTSLITVEKRPINIELKARYTWIGQNIYLEVEVRIYDEVLDKPVNRGYILVYLNKTGTYELIANKTIVNGKASLSGIFDPIEPMLKIVYIDPTGIYSSGETEGAYIESSELTRIPPPLPEPTITPTMLLLILTITLLLLHKKKMNSF